MEKMAYVSSVGDCASEPMADGGAKRGLQTS